VVLATSWVALACQEHGLVRVSVLIPGLTCQDDKWLSWHATPSAKVKAMKTMETPKEKDTGSEPLKTIHAHPVESEMADQESTSSEYIESIQSEEEDQESTPSEYKVMSYPADFTLEVLHEKWKSEEIIMPNFQRRFVWKQPQASKLIESFLLGLPVPPIFLYNKDEKLLVIDGQQRLKTIVSFFEGYFESDESRSNQSSTRRRNPFKLVNLNDRSRFNNKTFKMLQQTQKADYLKFKNSTLRSIIICQLDPQDDTSMYHIFERLNTGGTLLTSQEIRNCIYYGNFVKLLDKVDKYESWMKIIGRKRIDPQRKDAELILRFFAMRDISNYKKPMKNYLSQYMKEHHNATSQELDTYRKLFYNTCNEIVSYLGEKPFHLRSGLNPPALDSVMVAFSDHLGAIPDDIRERYKKLKEDEKFDETTRRGTTDKQTVKLRFERVKLILFDEEAHEN